MTPAWAPLAILVAVWAAGILGLVAYFRRLRQLNREKSRWGINFAHMDCEACGLRQPRFRRPANLRQALWGGWTCAGCSVELDKWGRRLSA